MNKLSADFRVAVLGAAGAVFTFSVFLLIDRIDSYYTYLHHIGEEGYESYGGVSELWWVPGVFWQVLLYIVASFVAHRYLAERCHSPFLMWQAVGILGLAGWLLTVSTAAGLECLTRGSTYPLERAADVLLTWFTAKFVATIFAGNVVYGSLIHSAASQYASPPASLGEA